MKTLLAEDDRSGNRFVEDDLARPVDLVWLMRWKTRDGRVQLETTKLGFVEVELHPSQPDRSNTVRLRVTRAIIPLFGDFPLSINEGTSLDYDICIPRVVRRHQPLIGNLPLQSISYWTRPTIGGRWRTVMNRISLLKPQGR